jgi:hypothetical protein
MPETRQPIDSGAETFSGRVDFIARRATLIGLTGLALVGVTLLSIAERSKDETPTSASKLEETYHYNGLDGITQESFLQLEYLTPGTINTVNWPQSPRLEREFGMTLQADVSQVSRKLFAMDAELPDRPVDEYDLAQALIPQDVQAEMRQQGVNLTPVAPIDCNINGLGNYDPLDYSTSLPRDFAVTLGSAGTAKQSMTVPLGAAQNTTADEIFSTTYDFMSSPVLYTLPCWAFPQSIPPSDLKQIY